MPPQSNAPKHFSAPLIFGLTSSNRKSIFLSAVKSPQKNQKDKNPLAGYVSIFYHLQSLDSERAVEHLINQELDGKRRDQILYALVTKLFQLKKIAFLKTLGVPTNGKRSFA